MEQTFQILCAFVIQLRFWTKWKTIDILELWINLIDIYYLEWIHSLKSRTFQA